MIDRDNANMWCMWSPVVGFSWFTISATRHQCRHVWGKESLNQKAVRVRVHLTEPRDKAANRRALKRRSIP